MRQYLRVFRGFLLVWLVLCAPVWRSFAQLKNTFYVEQFRGATVGEKTVNAQASCSKNAAIPCVIIFDPTLAGWEVGTMPDKCPQCNWIDYRRALQGASYTADLTARNFHISGMDALDVAVLTSESGVAGFTYSGVFAFKFDPLKGFAVNGDTWAFITSKHDSSGNTAIAVKDESGNPAGAILTSLTLTRLDGARAFVHMDDAASTQVDLTLPQVSGRLALYGEIPRTQMGTTSSGWAQLGPLTLIWVKGATDPTGTAEPSKFIPFVGANFTTKCLAAVVSTNITAASTVADNWYQIVGDCTTTGVTVQRQQPSTNNDQVTWPTVIAIGY